MPIEAVDIVRQYNNYLVCHDPHQRYPHWVLDIGQCVGYMVAYRRRCIILSTLAFFHVIHIVYVNDVAQVHITDRIAVAADKTHLPLGGHPTVHWSSAQTMLNDRIVAHVTVHDPDLLPLLGVSELVYTVAFLFALHVGIRMPALADEPVFAVPHMQGIGRSDSGFDDQNSNAYASIVITESLEYLGGGRSGVVYAGKFNGERVAYKFAESSNDQEMSEFDSSALLREVELYERFKQYQGRLIPRVVASNVVSGNVKGFCMELLDPLPHHFKEWTAEQRCEAVCVLKALLGHGLWQNDIRAANFGINSSGNVVMFDLEDCSMINLNEESKEGYVRTIENFVWV